MVEVNRQAYPVANFSAGGLLIGEAGFGFVTGQKLFLTLFHQARPSEKAFLYGHVIWIDTFRKVVGIDFVTPSEHSYAYLESMLTAASRRTTGRPPPKKQSWLGRLFK